MVATLTNMTSTNNNGPQYPAHGGAKITGDPALCCEALGAQSGSATNDPARNVAQGGASCLATCEPSLPLSGSPTRETASGFVLPRKKSKKKRAGCGAAAQKMQVERAASSAKSGVASGSVSSFSTTEKALAASAVVGSSPDSEELMEGTSLPSCSDDEDSVLDSPQRKSAPVVSAPAAEAEVTPAAEAEVAISGPSVVRTGRKRKTEVGPTPPQVTKKKKKTKRGSSFAAAYAQAEKNDLLGVVLARDNPYQVLSRVELARLRKALGFQVDVVIDSGATFIPRFTESGIRNSRFCLSCSNRESFDWLKNLLDSLEVGEGEEKRLRLRLATPDEVPKLSRAEVFITGEPPGEHRFLKNLQAQNPALHTGF